jgi:anti-anti-sigma factor
MSSYGLRMLLIGAKALRESDGNFYLASPNEHVSRVISVAGYDTIFPVYHSVQEAIADLKT